MLRQLIEALLEDVRTSDEKIATLEKKEKMFLETIKELKETQTCKQEYALARHIEPCRGLRKREKYQKAECVQRSVCFVYLQLSMHFFNFYKYLFHIIISL